MTLLDEAREVGELEAALNSVKTLADLNYALLIARTNKPRTLDYVSFLNEQSAAARVLGVRSDQVDKVLSDFGAKHPGIHALADLQNVATMPAFVRAVSRITRAAE